MKAPLLVRIQRPRVTFGFVVVGLFAASALGCRAIEARPLVLLSVSGSGDWSGSLVDHVLVTVADQSRQAPGP
ncbi:MAG TPA: hypothetical protein VGF45_23415, partial [Polyangia bacterium]